MRKIWKAKYAACVVCACLLTLILSSCSSSSALPQTTIYVADLDVAQLRLQNVRPITNRVGYNNQPMFNADGSLLYYIADSLNQTDVWKHHVAAGVNTQVTNTPEAEFSPTPMADGRSLSVVRVGKPRASDEEYTESQQLWRYDTSGKAISAITGTRRVGYHCWIGDGAVAMFIVGAEDGSQPHTLVAVDLPSRQQFSLAKNIGRTLRISPDGLLTYVDKSVTPFMIRSTSVGADSTTAVVPLPNEVEDFAWLDDGSILSTDGRQLILINSANASQKSLLGFEAKVEVGTIGRITVSSGGNVVAFVVTRR